MTPPALTTYQQASDLEPEVAAAFLQWGLALADTKHRLGIRTSEWVNGAPALEAAVGASAITQDELGHARSLYAVFKTFPEAPADIGAENDLEARQDYYCPQLLQTEWDSWVEVIVANVLFDRVTAVAVSAAQTSTFLPLKGRTAKILQEEAFHRIFGDSWLAKLNNMGETTRRQLQAAIDHFWPTAVAWFGPDDDETSRLLWATGIIDRTPAEMCEMWLAEVRPLLEKQQLALPALTVDWAGWRPKYREVGS